MWYIKYVCSSVHDYLAYKNRNYGAICDLIVYKISGTPGGDLVVLVW